MWTEWQKIIFILALSTISWSLSGCSFTDYKPGFTNSDKTISPEDLLSEANYEQVLLEFIITNQLFDTQTDSAALDSTHQALFSRFGTTKDLFFATHRAYEQDPKKQIERINRLRDEVQREMESISDYIRLQNSAQQSRP